MNVVTLQFVPKGTDGPELINDLTLSRTVKGGEKPIRNASNL